MDPNYPCEKVENTSCVLTSHIQSMTKSCSFHLFNICLYPPIFILDTALIQAITIKNKS